MQLFNSKIVEFITTEMAGDTSLFKQSPFHRGNVNHRGNHISFSYTRSEIERIAYIEKSISNFYDIMLSSFIKIADLEKYKLDLDFSKLNKFRFNSLPNCGKDKQIKIATILSIWFSLVNKDKTTTIICKHGELTKTRRAIIDLYEALPFYVKPGINGLANTSLMFDNGCRIKFANYSDAMRGYQTHNLIIGQFDSSNKDFNRFILPVIASLKQSRILLMSDKNIKLSKTDSFLDNATLTTFNLLK